MRTRGANSGVSSSRAAALKAKKRTASTTVQANTRYVCCHNKDTSEMMGPLSRRPLAATCGSTVAGDGHQMATEADVRAIRKAVQGCGQPSPISATQATEP